MQRPHAPSMQEKTWGPRPLGGIVGGLGKPTVWGSRQDIALLQAYAHFSQERNYSF